METSSKSPGLINLDLTFGYLQTHHKEAIKGLNEVELNQLFEILLKKFEDTANQIPTNIRFEQPGIVMKRFIEFIPSVLSAAIEEVKRSREELAEEPQFHHASGKPEARDVNIPVHLQHIAVAVAIMILITLTAVYGPQILEQDERNQALKMLRHNYSLLQYPFDEEEFADLSSVELWQEVAATTRQVEYQRTTYTQ